MMRRYLYTMIFSMFAFLANAQVESSGSIHFIDTSASNRKVTGIHQVQNSTNGINVNTYLTGKPYYASATGVNNIALTLPYNGIVTEGMLINFKAISVNTGAVTLSVNGSASYPLKKLTSQEIDSAEIQPGLMISAIFDGANFQTISKLYTPCRTGFVSVNNEYCIDEIPRGTSNFYNSIQTCGNENAMLCTWNQWFIACQDSTQNGSSNYLSNFEWVNDAGNNGTDAKVAGFNNDVAYNGYGCKKSYSLPPTLTQLNSATVTSGNTIAVRFRCCYKK